MIDTIVHRALRHADVRPAHPAYVHADGGVWRTTSWKAYVDEIWLVARALIAHGFAPGDTVAILSFNRPEWAIFDLAAMLAGGAAAGIYTTSSPDEVGHVVTHANARIVLVEDPAQWQKLSACLADRQVVFVRGADVPAHAQASSWDAFVARAAEVPRATAEARLAALRPDGLATLIYTSGTTGPAKGVMLSHANLTWTADALLRVQPWSADDVTLSYLPMSHVAEQAVSLMAPACSGSTVYYARALEHVPVDLKLARPTVFFGVPRIWEKFHAAVSARLDGLTGVKARLVAWARATATEVNTYRARGQALPWHLTARYRAADRLVLRKLKQALGFDRARLCVSGAAPIAPDVLAFFASLDLPILEVYGQSEGSGPTSINLSHRARWGTVGLPLPGVEVRIADDGEICVRGGNVFLGYLHEPAATAATVVDGWLQSGDLGTLDADGFLRITGRKKELIITAGGKNISPSNLEGALKESPLIAEAVVIGDRRKYLSVLLALDDAAVAAACPEGAQVDRAAPWLQAALQRAIDDGNAKLARVEQIKRFTILPRPLSIEAGDLTPTLKLKRANIARAFAAEIEAMYADLTSSDK